MTLSIYNSLTNRKETFTPVHPDEVRMYVCGMTVYGDAHIGHSRTYLSFDIIRRYLEYKGLKVTYIQNITDVDDKIINSSQEQGIDALEYSRMYTERCLDALSDMGIRPADFYPKASETIQDMVELIEQIIDNGYAYESEGDVYFDVLSYQRDHRDYGNLSGQNPDDLQSGARISSHEKKRSPLDFALWKASKPGEPHWSSPWGEGRPGWHIECSAMSARYLGLPFDIHGGGMDLRFPHHENEIVQAKAATGKDFARFWMHSGLLTINGEKMSKSLGNFITVNDAIQKYGSELIRIFFAQAHYRSPPDFSEKNLEDTKKGLERIHRFEEKLIELAGDATPSIEEQNLNQDEQSYLELIKTLDQGFNDAMDDDFNTPKAFAVIYEFITSVYRQLEHSPALSSNLHAYALQQLHTLGNVLTLFQEEAEDNVDEELINAIKNVLLQFEPETTLTDLEAMMDRLLQLREEARKNKVWNIADSIRDQLSAQGFEIQDTSDGPVWRKTR